MDAGEVYHIGFWITWAITFLIVWVCCATEGMIGFCLSWMPAVFIVFLWRFSGHWFYWYCSHILGLFQL